MGSQKHQKTCTAAGFRGFCEDGGMFCQQTKQPSPGLEIFGATARKILWLTNTGSRPGIERRRRYTRFAKRMLVAESGEEVLSAIESVGRRFRLET